MMLLAVVLIWLVFPVLSNYGYGLVVLVFHGRLVCFIYCFVIYRYFVFAWLIVFFGKGEIV